MARLLTMTVLSSLIQSFGQQEAGSLLQSATVSSSSSHGDEAWWLRSRPHVNQLISVSSLPSHGDAARWRQSRPRVNQRCSQTLVGLSPEPNKNRGVNSPDMRVVLAAFPGTGQAWMRILMHNVAEHHGLPSPIGDIYGEGINKQGFDGVSVWDKDWDGTKPHTVLFKTQFPSPEYTSEMFRDHARSKASHNASMHFDKMVILLRHPHATVKSHRTRWMKDGSPGMPYKFAEEDLACWGNWWQRVVERLQEQDNERILYVRFEDLCEDTAKTTADIFGFLGGDYSQITKEHVESFIAENDKIHASDEDKVLFSKCEFTQESLQNQALRYKDIEGQHKLLDEFDAEPWSSHYNTLDF